MAIILTITIKNVRIYPSSFLTDSLLDTQAPAAFPIAKISPILKSTLSLKINTENNIAVSNIEIES